MTNTLELPKKPASSLKSEPPKTESIRREIPLFAAIFHFFASLRLAVLVLSALMAALIAGTLIESFHGADAAKILVYQAPWFALIMLTLAVNLAASALSRLPWQKKHIGFVITHLGIILLLAGSYQSQKQMIDGQMILAEKETESHITLFEPILYVVSEEGEWFFDLQKHAFPWRGNISLLKDSKSGLEINQTADYPKASFTSKILPAETGDPAVKIRLKNAFIDQTQWLRNQDPDFGQVDMGPAKLAFASELIPEKQAEIPEEGYLEFQINGKNIRFPLSPQQQTPFDFQIEGTPYTAKIQKLYREARVEGKNLVDKGSEADFPGKNPAVEILLEGPGVSENHTVFSQFPDFPTMHGMKPSPTGMKIVYHLPGGASESASNELRFVFKDEKLLCQIRTGTDVVTKTVQPGKPVKTGWMDISVTVEEFYPHSRIEQEYKPEHSLSEKPGVAPAIALEIIKDGKKYPVWLAQGAREETQIGSEELTLIYGQKKIPASFRLTLKDFRMEEYPGTNRPASFESDVTLRDDSRGVLREETISMNNPLVYRGFRIYQSGYQADPGSPEISIFTVGRDPGVPLKYAATIVIISGIILMFYTRRFSTTSGKAL